MGCWPRPWRGGKIGTVMGYLGGAAIGGQAWEKQGEAGVEIPSAEGSPDLTWSQTGWPQLGASGKHGFWMVLCRGPAPADPGYSKERRLGEGQGTTA